MFKVKLLTMDQEILLLRQTPGSSGIWGNYRFFINEDIEDYDYLVVYESLPKSEIISCPFENTIFITGEPPSVRKYDPEFLRKFATIITSHRDIQHPHVIHTQQGLPWHFGYLWENNTTVIINKDYDKLKAINNFKKEKLISVIVSNKAFTEGHYKRLEFVRDLLKHFGSAIDIFGRGIRDIADKWEAIAPYKYHIVLENSSFPDYWTEKLADAFLCGSYPFYYGCLNIADYFSPDSYTPIDIYDSEKSISIIEKTIVNQQYEKSIDKITNQRNLVLNKYNLFPMIVNICNRLQTCQEFQ